MSAFRYNKRSQSVPIIYTRGTHYEIGFHIGRTFRSMIQNALNSQNLLHSSYIPYYESNEGKEKIDEILKVLQEEYPQYLKELEGIADGAQLAFIQLFLLNINDFLPSDYVQKQEAEGSGCSSVSSTVLGQEALGHTEDGLALYLNNWFIVDAHITSEQTQGRWEIKEEKFATFCYAGMLPGYTMGYNKHGLVHCCNTVSTSIPNPGKIPVNFVGRSILAARSLTEAETMMKHQGFGLISGINVNFALVNKENDSVQFAFAEAGPPSTVDPENSAFAIHYGRSGDHFYHCNTYRKLKSNYEVTNEKLLASTRARQKKIESLPPPKSKEEVIAVLQDKTIFRDYGIDDKVKTIVAGVFDLPKRTWSIYVDDSKNKPLATLSMHLDD